VRLRGLPQRVVLEVLFGVHQRVCGGAKILDVTLRAVGDTLRREQAPVIAACPAQMRPRPRACPVCPPGRWWPRWLARPPGR
jgi:hypothetical protein